MTTLELFKKLLNKLSEKYPKDNDVKSLITLFEKTELMVKEKAKK